MSLGAAVRLFHHAWSVRVLAALAEAGGGARFVVLVNRLGVGRSTLSASLRTLAGLDLVVRNPGHGHPLRPEYVLTGAGATLGSRCAMFQRAVERLAVDAVVYRKWSVPTLLTMRDGPVRFNEMVGRLSTVTPRALADSLGRLQAGELVHRRVGASGLGARARYRLTRSGAVLARSGARIACARELGASAASREGARGYPSAQHALIHSDPDEEGPAD